MAKSRADEWHDPEKLMLLEAWARDGLTNEQISHNMGISRETLNQWKNKYTDIFDALKKGKEVVDIEVENALCKSAKGFWYQEEVVSTKKEVIYSDGKRVKEVSEPVVVTLNRFKPSETAAAIFWLKNRKPDKWREKQEVSIDKNPIEDLTPLAELLKGNKQ